jgi:nicotinate-nucleotide pyrophosphorylase
MTSTESYEHLLPPSWKTEVSRWLAEDTPSFDYGGYVVGEAEREAFLFGKGKHAAVLAGSPFFTEIFKQLDCQSVSSALKVCVALIAGRVEWHVKEGETFEPVKHVATVRGKARFLLLGERVALNLLARCSGIATKCASLFVASSNTKHAQIYTAAQPGKRIRFQGHRRRHPQDNTWYDLVHGSTCLYLILFVQGSVWWRSMV